MATEIKPPMTKEQKARLQCLTITVSSHLAAFIRWGTLASQPESKSSYAEGLAEQSINEIEDAIRRYREGRKQAFEEI